jgi:hypothetical protein
MRVDIERNNAERSTEFKEASTYLTSNFLWLLNGWQKKIP